MSTFIFAEDQLAEEVGSALLYPGSEGYEAARQAWNLTVDQHPELIVVARSAGDVAAAVRHANRTGMGIAVQSTGHGIARSADGALLIVTSQLGEVCVDPSTRTAWVEAGVKWGQVLEQAQSFGLAPLLGSAPHVGVVGYTLGGGMGWLARKYGLAADSVNFFELITPDGRLARASADENADLFWGLRGGGGNFGIVTGMEIRLYPVTEVYGGNLIYPIELAHAVFARYRGWIADMPEEMTSSVVLMNYPPLPQLPPILRGRSVVMVRGCYVGAIEDGATLVDRWRSWQAPLIDDFKPMPFSAVGRISSDPVGPIAASSTGAWLVELSDEAIDLLIEYGKPQAGLEPITKIEIRHAGGAIAKVDPGVNAYGNRDATLNMQFIGITPTPEAREIFKEHSDELKGKLHPYLTGGVFMNFLEGAEARRRTPDAYSAQTYEWLVALKAQIDPQNRMNHSFHIPSVMELEPVLA